EARRLARRIFQTRSGFRQDQSRSVKSKSPGPRSGAFAWSLVACSELPVQATAHDVRVERDVVVRGHAAIDAAIEAAEIDVEVLGLGAEIIGDRVFDAAAERPAGTRVARTGEARHVGLDFAEGCAPGHVRHEAIERVAEATAHGAEPGILRFAAAERGAADVRPTNVAFEAEHGLADLIIVSGGSAGGPTGDVE